MFVNSVLCQQYARDLLQDQLLVSFHKAVDDDVWQWSSPSSVLTDDKEACSAAESDAASDSALSSFDWLSRFFFKYAFW